jgi:hypothetical protein
MSAGIKMDMNATDGPNDPTAHQNLFASYFAVNCTMPVDHHRLRAGITMDGPVDMQFTCRDQAPFDDDVLADIRGRCIKL